MVFVRVSCSDIPVYVIKFWVAGSSDCWGLFWTPYTTAEVAPSITNDNIISDR